MKASDAAANTASASFDVHVKGADEQLDDLIGGRRPASVLARAWPTS